MLCSSMSSNQKTNHSAKKQDIESALKASFFEMGIDGRNSFSFAYCKMHIQYVSQQQQVRQVREQISNLKQLIEGELVSTAEKECDSPTSKQLKHRRMRRTASQISRHFVCPVQFCRKEYGSEGSLNHHLKLKHQELYTNKNDTNSPIQSSN